MRRAARLDRTRCVCIESFGVFDGARQRPRFDIDERVGAGILGELLAERFRRDVRRRKDPAQDGRFVGRIEHDVLIALDRGPLAEVGERASVEDATRVTKEERIS